MVLIAAAVVGGVIVWKKRPGPASTIAETTATTATPATPKLPPQAQRMPYVHDADPEGAIRLEGQVIDAKDQPVADATVGIDSNPPLTAKTDASGAFVFEHLLPRAYRLEAQAKNGYAGPVRVRLGDKPEPVTLRLKPGANVEVLVTDGTAPIANADVELRGTVLWSATTNAQGIATLEHVGEVWAPLHASATGFAPNATMLGTSGEAPMRVSIRLSKGADVSGMVVDAHGKPQVAWIVATNASEPFPVIDAKRDGIASGADGRFAFPSLSKGTWRLTATAAQFAPAISDPLIIDGPRANVKLTLLAGSTLKGKVVDKAGAPVSANVRVIQRGNVFLRDQRLVHTKADGSFAIEGLPQRPADVVAQSEHGASQITPVDLTRDLSVTLTLDIDGAITGTVIDKGGQPIGDAQVIAEAEPTGKPTDLLAWVIRGPQETVTDQGGGFALTGLPAGNYRVRASRPGASEDEQELAPFAIAKPGGPALQLVLAREGTIKGKVAFADGTVPLAFTVRLGNTYGTPFAATDGTFSLTAIAGVHGMVVDGQSFAAAKSRDVSITEGKTTDVGTIVVEKGRSISGRVRDQSGTPVADAKVAAGHLLTGGGAELYIADESIAAKDTTSDANGNFRIDGFPPGPITVVAGKDNVGRSNSVQIPTGTDSATIDLVLAPTAGIEGKVMRSGQPIGDTVVIASPIGASSQNFFVITGADGTYALDALAPGSYVIYPLIGGGGAKPKDMYIVKTTVTAGSRTHLDLDATPGPATLSVTATQNGSPLAMGQLFLIEATVAARTLEDLRALDQLDIFSAGAIPFHIRGVMGGSVDVEGVRPGDYTLCVAAFAGRPPDDLTQVPTACQPVVMGTGKQTVALVLK